MFVKRLQRFAAVSLIALFAAALLPTGAASPAHAQSAATMPLWKAADDLRGLLVEAQQAVLLAGADASGPVQEAVSQVDAASTLYAETLSPVLAESDPARDDAIRQALADAAQAAAQGDSPALAQARGRVWTGLLRGAYHQTLAAASAGDIETAEAWLRIREYRSATRVTVVDNPAAAAISTMGQGQLTPEAAAAIVSDDLHDAYFFQLREAVSEVGEAAGQEYSSRAAEWASLAQGYYLILRDDYAAKQGEEAAAELETLLGQLDEAVLAQNWQAAGDLLGEVEARVQTYQPVELSVEDIAQKSQLLYIFSDLVNVEYRDGVRNGRITLETEYREALTFRDQAEITFQELRPVIEAVDAQQAERLGRLLSDMEDVMLSYGDEELVAQQSAEVLGIIEATLGEQSDTADDASTFTAIHSLLDDLLAAVAQGDYEQAERLRVQAYALYDFGPELHLLGVSPRLVAAGDGLFWYGDGGQEGLASAIGRRASSEEIDALLASLRGTLEESQRVLGEKVSPGAVVFNSAAIVFREGLEAVIILAALLASMAKPAYRSYRRPLVAGSALAFLATAVTWVITRRVLISLSSWGERLEAVVSLIAIGVLLLITNWFFHKVYWKDWMANFHKMKGKLLSAEIGQIVGLMFLGFTSVYREGFETVLFLQASVLDAGSAVVFQGIAVGLIGVAIIGFITFSLQRKLPYMHMLIATGILIGLVLVTMVGGTVRTLQAIGWMPITPIMGFQPPYWMGQWFGVYPTWQSILLQIASGVFVIGSYFLAEGQKKRQRAHKREAVQSSVKAK